MKRWKDVKIGDVLNDGSVVTQKHEIHIKDCYQVEYSKFLKKRKMNLSEDHYLLINISKSSQRIKEFLKSIFGNAKIAESVDYKVYVHEEWDSPDLRRKIEAKLKMGENYDYDTTAYSDVKVNKAGYMFLDENNLWMKVKDIHFFLSTSKEECKFYCNGWKLRKAKYIGEKEVMCVSTDTGRYTLNDLIHHNSVTVRNIIFHVITHSYQFSIGLVDIKETEFTRFRGMKGVIGVANSVKEAAELLRIARAIMYKRNKQMAKLEIDDIVKFKPQKPTNMFHVSGREFPETQKLKVKMLDGQETEMTITEIDGFLKQAPA